MPLPLHRSLVFEAKKFGEHISVRLSTSLTENFHPFVLDSTWSQCKDISFILETDRESSTKGKLSKTNVLKILSLLDPNRVLDRSTSEGRSQTSGKNDLSRLVLSSRKENRNSLSLAQGEREREEDGKNVGRSGRVERKEEEEEGGWLPKKCWPWRTFSSLRCLASRVRFKGLNSWRTGFRVSNASRDGFSTRIRAPRTACLSTGFVSRTKLSPRGEQWGETGESNAKLRWQMKGDLSSLGRKTVAEGGLFLFVARRFYIYIFVFPSWTRSWILRWTPLFSIDWIFIIDLSRLKMIRKISLRKWSEIIIQSSRK